MARAGRGIMYLGGKEMRRPKGPAKLKGILEKREAVLSKWRDGRIFARSILIRILRANYQFSRYQLNILNRFTLLGRRKNKMRILRNKLKQRQDLFLKKNKK